MQKVAIIVLLITLLSPLIVVGNTNQQQQSSNSPYQIIVNYPKQVYLGQSFTISFELVTSVINSTNFQYITPGTRVVDVNGQKAYEGFGSYWMINKVNLTNASELIVSFVGRIIGNLRYNPGIVLYGYNFSTSERDGQIGNYEILTAWSGILYLDKLKGWFRVISTLPSFYSGNYTVVFKNVNSSVYIYAIFVNSSMYIVKYNTGIPWNSIGFVGIRPDTDTVLPESFIVKALVPSKYVIYVNGKEYSSGYSATGKIEIKAFSPMTVNITFPQLHMYKVITISPNGDIKTQFPTLEISLIVLTVIVIGIGIVREFEKRR